VVAPTTPAEHQLTIDDLARRVELPVRTIREYHTMRLLPPPARRGRVGFYGARHVQRLELIARLQRRGYSLAGIRDLLEAWDSGTELTTLLGVDRGPVALDETPLRLTRAELFASIPGLDEATLRRAESIGLVRSVASSDFLVRSPALLGLIADGVRLGVSLGEMLDVIGGLITELDALAKTVAGSIVERIWQPVTGGDHEEDLPGFLARGRLLLVQGVASTLADRLGAALLDQAADLSGGDALRAALERIRVGVITDSAGTLQRRGSR
jgi:DNA-binding transcriptional MerR regulator